MTGQAHLLRGLGLGCLGGSGCALTAVLCGAAAPVWATMVCAGAALGVLGAEGQLQQAAEAPRVGTWNRCLTFPYFFVWREGKERKVRKRRKGRVLRSWHGMDRVHNCDVKA